MGHAKAYVSEAERTVTYETWLHHYNHHRPHAGIGGSAPSARFHNLSGNYSWFPVGLSTVATGSSALARDRGPDRDHSRCPKRGERPTSDAAASSGTRVRMLRTDPKTGRHT